MLVLAASGQDIVGRGWNVRTAVQEYGGGAAIVHNNIAYFSNLSDGAVYQVKDAGQPERVTPGKYLINHWIFVLIMVYICRGKTIPLCMS